MDQESTFFICDARRGYGRGAPLIRRNIEINKKFSIFCIKTLDKLSHNCYNIDVKRMEVLRNERLQGIGKQQRKSD